MEINYANKKIELKNKEINYLDKLVVGFTSILNEFKIEYIIVSGYVAILFGRSRDSEDIDIIMEKISFEKFEKLWRKLDEKFECVNTSDVKDAYNDYLLNNTPIRFSIKNSFIPNVEIKFPKIDLDYWSLDNKLVIILNGFKFYTSPLELQIAFKLYLGSEKNIEDAKHLWIIFKDKLDKSELDHFLRKLNKVDMFNKYLK